MTLLTNALLIGLYGRRADAAPRSWSRTDRIKDVFPKRKSRSAARPGDDARLPQARP